VSEVSLGGSRVSGTISPLLSAWQSLSALDMSGTILSGSLDAALAQWAQGGMSLDLSYTRLSGTIPPELATAWNPFSLDLSHTDISGAVPQDVCTWVSLTSLSLAHTAISGTLPGCLFNLSYTMPVLDFSYARLQRAGLGVLRSAARLLSLAHNNISYLVEDCPANATMGAPPLYLDMSGNPWPGVGIAAAVSCFVGAETSMNTLLLNGMQLGGALMENVGTQFLSPVQTLGLSDNMISADSTQPSAYFVNAPLLQLQLDGNPLSDRVNIDRATYTVATLEASNTSVAFCYEGAALGSSQALRIGLRGVRPSPTCNRALEAEVPFSFFQPCPAEAALSGRALSTVFCRSTARSVAFNASGLQCPAWSTFVTGGTLDLAVDAAFLLYWGCVCPPGWFWGYSRTDLALVAAALRAEAAAMGPFTSLGQNESALVRRACQPCPPGLDCSPLAVVDAPHQLSDGSRYPLAPPQMLAADAGFDPLARRNFVWVDTVACLHPTVCNRPAYGAVAVWDDWSALVRSGTTVLPEFARYQCRRGHNASSLLCSRCEDGFWLDGLLCQPCHASYGVLMPLTVVLATLALVAYVRQRVQLVAATYAAAVRDSAAQRLSASRGAQEHIATATQNTTSLVLWFVQVSATLQISTQINATRSATVGAEDEHTLSDWSASWLRELLSFRPWGGECVIGRQWEYTSSSLALLVLPWLATAAGGALALLHRRRAPEWLCATYVVLDLLYLPVVQRATEWFNQQSLAGKVRPTRSAGARADACFSVSATCVYRPTCRATRPPRARCSRCPSSPLPHSPWPFRPHAAGCYGRHTTCPARRARGPHDCLRPSSCTCGPTWPGAGCGSCAWPTGANSSSPCWCVARCARGIDVPLRAHRWAAPATVPIRRFRCGCLPGCFCCWCAC
jgi:hypothetical protein